ncbi:MAG: hypothetical protein U9Q81_26280 [Pseudomonadota bacterium]|nr:hypothetical protein [Pseudomonadota bacterium]
MNPIPSTNRLERENETFSGTGGVSAGNRSRGFWPAFRDERTGRVFVSRFGDGRFAPMHLLDGLPEDLVLTRSAGGQVLAVKETVISGFLRSGRFYSRTEAALALA